jgi:hypothetical protein
MPVREMRGQASLEFLILFAVFLSILIIAIGAITRIEKLGRDGIGKRSAELLANDISNAINNACILGDGNRRTVESRMEFSLSSEGNGILLRAGNAEIKRSTMCEAVVEGNQFSGTVWVENRGGEVHIS